MWPIVNLIMPDCQYKEFIYCDPNYLQLVTAEEKIKQLDCAESPTK